MPAARSTSTLLYQTRRHYAATYTRNGLLLRHTHPGTPDLFALPLSPSVVCLLRTPYSVLTHTTCVCSFLSYHFPHPHRLTFIRLSPSLPSTHPLFTVLPSLFSTPRLLSWSSTQHPKPPSHGSHSALAGSLDATTPQKAPASCILRISHSLRLIPDFRSLDPPSTDQRALTCTLAQSRIR